MSCGNWSVFESQISTFEAKGIKVNKLLGGYVVQVLASFIPGKDGNEKKGYKSH